MIPNIKNIIKINIKTIFSVVPKSFELSNETEYIKSFVLYEYNGRKYIRFVGDNNCDDETLSNGEKIEVNNIYWVEVKPIK